MRKPSFILLLTLLFGGLWPVSAQNIALTVYSRGTALIREQRRLSLEPGINLIQLDDVAATIDPASVRLESLSGPATVTVLEQSYVYDLVNRAALLARYLDQTIYITAADGALYRGELLGGGDDQAILRLENGDIAVISLDDARDIRFPALPDALITRPALQWTLSSSAGGDQDVTLTYLADGINWTADYNILLDDDLLDIKGWVTLSNHSGRAFEDAQLKLVAGDIHRIQPQPMLAESRAIAFDAAEQKSGQESGIEQRELFDYQLYEISRAIAINPNETKQIEFISGASIAATRLYVFDSSPQFGGYYAPIDYPEGYGDDSSRAVLTYLQFSAGPESGLDADLPGGRMRVYQADVDGAGLLIGEDTIDHTPVGEDVSILLGKAFDLVGERRQTDFETISRDVIQETFEIRLRSRKDDETIEVQIPERLYRWSSWEIIDSSAPYERKDSSSIEFRLQLAAGHEEILTYTVQYRLPRNR